MTSSLVETLPGWAKTPSFLKNLKSCVPAAGWGGPTLLVALPLTRCWLHCIRNWETKGIHVLCHGLPSSWFVHYTPRRPDSTANSLTLEASVSSLDLWSMAFVFLLAAFVGFQVIQNVSRLLHTPLMSLTNAISAIAVVGSIVIAGEQKSVLTTVLGAVAVAASMTNIVSGFLITDRMLKMFKERGPKS